MNQQKQNMSSDEIAASLAFATKLSEGLMPKAQDASQSPQDQPGSTQTPQETQPSTPDQNDPKFTELEAQLKFLKTDIEVIKQAVTNKAKQEP